MKFKIAKYKSRKKPAVCSAVPVWLVCEKKFFFLGPLLYLEGLTGNDVRQSAGSPRAVGERRGGVLFTDGNFEFSFFSNQG